MRFAGLEKTLPGGMTMIEPTREEIEKTEGPLLLEFGASWCPICQAFTPQLESVLKKHPNVRHVKVEDGKGKLLGRSFRVKLWPNFVFLRDGQVLAQLARPSISEVEQQLQAIEH